MRSISEFGRDVVGWLQEVSKLEECPEGVLDVQEYTVAKVTLMMEGRALGDDYDRFRWDWNDPRLPKTQLPEVHLLDTVFETVVHERLVGMWNEFKPVQKRAEEKIAQNTAV